MYAHEDGYGSDLVITNLATGTSSALYHTDKSIGQSAFTPKGDEIYFVAQTEQLDAHVMHVPVDGGEAKPVTEAHDWHEWSFALSPDAQHMRARVRALRRRQPLSRRPPGPPGRPA